MKKLKKLYLVLAITFIASTYLTACGSGKSSETTGSEVLSETATDSADGENVFTYALPSDIVSLDPAYAYDLITGPVVNQITESLLTFDSDGLLQPLLVESWDSVDPTTYKYTVRQDVTFSDGTPMTMEDVLFSIERYMNPEVASYIAWMYDSVESVEQTGDWELTVKLTQPDALWQYVFATSGGHIISKAYYEAHSEDFGKPTGGTMGTGPYVYKSWDTGSQIVLVKNENYWDTSVTLDVDKIVYPIIVEDTTRVQAMINGEVDFTTDPPIDMMTDLESASNLVINSFDSFAIDFLAFNTEVPPFDDINVRRAIASLVDKETVANNIMKDYASAGNALQMGPALFTIEKETWEKYQTDAVDYEYNLEKAKEYIAQSAYPDGFTCRFLTNELSSRNSMALMLQQLLAELNITVEIQKVTNDELINIQFGSTLTADGAKDYDMGIFTWISDFPDPSGNLYPLFLSANAAPGGSNTTAFKNAEVDELLAAEKASLDPAERTKLLMQVGDIIADQVPQTVIDYPKTICVFGENVEPFEVSSAYIWNLYIKNVIMK